ncbi:hypothetical protein HYE59_12420 [Aggregatibacter actinomycetemcomitans]|uniref:hypothetical protein n=1 Tax=Aggregatibacter actinomycetemcomitans TaxID=714 RepID=UPI00197B0C6F|nr:hypothetical protein [Aggregatibacter actinomycetemcomitans]MBN6078300.1 hypothetical protein [Aggregatibacter actinomycetemcomitans]
MNLFYDDLSKSSLEEDIVYFKSKGVTFKEGIEIKGGDVNNMSSNLFAYLEDYKNMGFKFIDIPEQLIEIKWNDECFFCFGKCRLGYFILNSQNQVYMMVNKYNSGSVDRWLEEDDNDRDYEIINKYIFLVKDVPILFVNSSLEDFLKSYSYFMMGVFSLKSQFDKLNFVVKNEVNNFERKLLDLSPISIKLGTFWSEMAYAMEHLNISLTSGIIPYIKPRIN